MKGFLIRSLCYVFAFLLSINLYFGLYFGRFLGFISYYLLKRRRTIAFTNIAACLKDKTIQEQKKIARDSFVHAGQSLVETLILWFVSPKRLNRFYNLKYVHESYLDSYTKDQQRGILLLGAHTSNIDCSGFLLAQDYPVSVVYKKLHQQVFNQLIEESRAKIVQEQISHRNLITVIKRLRKNQTIWYAPDQDFGHDNSIFCDFLGQQKACLTATTLLAQKTGAIIIPIFSARGKRINEVILEMAEPFESTDEQSDVRRYNHALGDFILRYPDNYFWMHRMFKTQPEGEKPFYE